MDTKKIKNLQLQLSKYLTIGITILILLFGFSILAAALPNEIKTIPYNSDEEQIKNAIANDQRVIMKWAQLAYLLGFSGCNGTKSPNIGEDFSINRDDFGNYILQANYRVGDPYAGGEGGDERLKIVLSNFKIDFNSANTKWENPIITKSAQSVEANYKYQNKSNKEKMITKQFQYLIAPVVTHSPSIEFGDKIKLQGPWSVPSKFGELNKVINLIVTPQAGWKASIIKINESKVNTNYKTKIPPRTNKLIEKITQTVQSDIKYTATANLSYNVSFHGILKRTGNAKIDHPNNGTIVDLSFGDDKKSAAETLWDLYTHGNITGYNAWIDWGWIKNTYSNCKDVIENKIYNSPEFVNVTGKFSCSYIMTYMRDGLTTQTSPLAVVSITRNIPVMLVGNNFNMAQLSLSGKDTKNNPYYDFKNLPVTWIVTSGGDFAYISGSNLIAKGEGVGMVVAIVQGVTSNPVSFTIKSRPYLKNIILSGAIPTIYVGNNYNLTQLAIAGKDQYGNNFNIAGLPITYSVTSGANFAYINGNTLIAYGADYNRPGYGTVSVTVQGLSSNPVSFIIKTPLVLTSLALANNLPLLYVGDSFDLTKLKLTGKDQYGDNFNISGKPVIWNILSGGSYINISNNVFKAYSSGSGIISGTINGVTSNQINFNVINHQVTQRILRTLVISGAIPTMYVGASYDLSRLALTGYDQYGDYYYIAGQSVLWSITSGWNAVGISNNVLRTYAVGTGGITATINGVVSNQISVTITSPAPIWPLKSLVLSGTLPSLNIGDSFDLTRLSLVGFNAAGGAYNISGLPQVWAVSNGYNLANISGNILKIVGAGSSSIMVNVSGIVSNVINFTVREPAVLKTISLTDNKPTFSVGKEFNLSQLELKGTDQYGNSFNISGLPITWSVTSVKGLVGISGSSLKPNNEDAGSIAATIQGITSNLVSFKAVKDPQILTTLTLTGEIPNLSLGKSFDLTKLKLECVDQYGDPYNMNGQTITFSITQTGNTGTISGNILKANSEGIGIINANVKGVFSNYIRFIVIKEPSVVNTLITKSTALTLTIGIKYDLSKVIINAFDQYGSSFNIKGRQIKWKTVTNAKLVYISGNSLIPITSGKQTIIASLGQINSKPINITVKGLPKLKTITISNSIRTLIAGSAYDLSNFILKGFDQNGNTINISLKPVTWKVTSNAKLTTVSGRVLKAKAPGKISLTATIQGITSKSISLVIEK